MRRMQAQRGGTIMRGGFTSLSSGLAFGLVSALAVSGAHAGIHGSEIGNDELVTIQVASRTGTPVGLYGDRSYNLQGLAGDAATGRLWGLSAETGRLYSVDATTGASSVFSDALFVNNANGLAFDPLLNHLWVSNNAGGLWTYDLGTGVADFRGTAATGDLEGLAFDAATRTLYALGVAGGTVYTVDTGTLALSPVVSLGPGTWRGLTYDASTDTLVASRVGTETFIAEIDPLTGQVIGQGVVTGIGQFTQGLAYIPAPGVIAVAALSGLAALRRR
jgi:DNA-binding beta-propeller fold protein YncE